uniref:(northern house mosquito) hypothetical protein n=1 Tax=Culex pipiens TaxID=7175 RepID=A0A8D8A5J2_CULPI
MADVFTCEQLSNEFLPFSATESCENFHLKRTIGNYFRGASSSQQPLGRLKPCAHAHHRAQYIRLRSCVRPRLPLPTHTGTANGLEASCSPRWPTFDQKGLRRR